MAVTVDDLANLVGTRLADPALAPCLAFGQAVVAKFTSTVTAGDIPDAVLDEAVLTAAADQFQRRNAPNGVLNQVYDNGNGAIPVRISRDPFSSIKPILRPWVAGRGSLRTVSLIQPPDPV